MSPFNRREVGPWEALPTRASQRNGWKRGKKRSPKCRREAERQQGRCCGTASGIHPHGAAFRPATSPHSSAPSPTPTDSSSCWRRAGVPQPAENMDGGKTWMGIKCAVVTLLLSAGEGCRLQAEDAARLLSVEKAAHLPASACQVAGKGSPLPPVLCLILSIFCSVLEVSLTPSPSTLSPAPGRIFMRWEDSPGRDQKKAGTLCCERFLGFCHCASDPEAWQAEKPGQHDPIV